jgi:hypothetical protein
MATRKKSVKKKSVKRAASKRSVAKEATARTTASKKAASKRSASKKAASKKSASKKATSKKAASKRAASKKATTRKTARREAPAPARRAPSRQKSESGKYVYCIVRSEKPLRFGPIGIGAEAADVHTVRYRDIAAVVSDTPLEVYDPTRENVLAHEQVNEEVMRRHTVIPMSFGTVFKTADDIVELLKSAYDAFDDVLAKMHGKLEFGVKVLWEPDVVVRKIEEADENVRRLKAEISSERGSTYFARMQYGRLVDALLEARSEEYIADILSTLRPVSTASRTNKPIGDKMLMNAAFLVSRDQEAAFDAAVKTLGARHEALTFKYTGPWPPYNFVNIRLKLERAAEGA